MPLLQLRQVTLQYTSAPLLDQVNFQVEPGERVCLLGRNGAGKTSLMRVITGEEKPDQGEVIRPPGTRMTRLDQEIPDDVSGLVLDVVREGLNDLGAEEEWEADARVETLLLDMHLPPYVEFSTLSGGLKRRVLLARALAGQPDLLLLDEPTNHLDLSSILWLEQYLANSPTTLFFVTHDRTFLKKLATRIVEIDRGALTSWACDYNTYLERKAANLAAEEKQWAAFDKKLAQEEAWLRQGVKARRTRNEGRVRALGAMRAERAKRRERDGTARIELQEGATSGQKVIEAKNVTFGYDGEPVIRDFSTAIWRGDKIGIIGPNGGGKSTLLKLMLGRLEPNSGSVKLGTNLQIVYLDQLRGQIDGEKTVAENVAGDAETVTFQGKPRHIHSYLQDFLFRSDRIRMPARLLSGGERNRLLLARLFLQPANVLVMDEPTNDLDAETLELLEELLTDYQGTLLLVSHDRTFLDNVVTGTMVFEEPGRIEEYVGGYEDWLRQRAVRPSMKDAPPPVTIERPRAETPKAKPAQKFLNREKRELEELPALLEKLEAQQSALATQLQSTEAWKGKSNLASQLHLEMTALTEQISTAYARWEELEEKRQQAEP